jgi:hypothetical protein
LHRLVENEEVSVYCDANVDISHVALPGTKSDANYLATSFQHGWTRRNKRSHTKGVEFLLDEHKKNPHPTFYERRGDERREKVRCLHAGAPHQHPIYYNSAFNTKQETYYFLEGLGDK